MDVATGIRLLWRTDRFGPGGIVDIKHVEELLRQRPEISVWRIRKCLLVRRRSGWGGSPPLPVAVFRPGPGGEGVVATLRIPRYRAFAWAVAPIVLLGGAIGGLFNWLGGKDDLTNFLTALLLFVIFTVAIAGALGTARQHFQTLGEVARETLI